MSMEANPALAKADLLKAQEQIKQLQKEMVVEKAIAGSFPTGTQPLAPGTLP
jgi:hypothetical protein